MNPLTPVNTINTSHWVLIAVLGAPSSCTRALQNLTLGRVGLHLTKVRLRLLLVSIWPYCASHLAIPGSINTQPGKNGRTEVACVGCDGHIGYLFLNEGFKQPSEFFLTDKSAKRSL